MILTTANMCYTTMRGAVLRSKCSGKSPALRVAQERQAVKKLEN